MHSNDYTIFPSILPNIDLCIFFVENDRCLVFLYNCPTIKLIFLETQRAENQSLFTQRFMIFEWTILLCIRHDGKQMVPKSHT